MSKLPTQPSLSALPMHDKNPFMEQTLDHVGNMIVYKTNKNGNPQSTEGAILKAVNSNNEVVGHTTFVTKKVVDSDKYTKFFLTNFKQFYDLKPASIKVFGYILELLKPNSDVFYIVMSDCVEKTGYTRQSIYKALAELCNHDIIARGRSDFEYFINPMVVFNGNRITFATTYIRKETNNRSLSEYQLKKEIQLNIEKKSIMEKIQQEEYDNFMKNQK